MAQPRQKLQEQIRYSLLFIQNTNNNLKTSGLEDTQDSLQMSLLSYSVCSFKEMEMKYSLLQLSTTYYIIYKVKLS